MPKSILSICISSFNRAEKVVRLVNEILSCDSTKLSVVVMDDGSNDSTVEDLQKITDSRFSFYHNKKNLGARKNWYETINKGNGEYILQLLDRDWIRTRYIEKIIELLENNTCGFGYIGEASSIILDNKKKEPYCIFNKGDEAMLAWSFQDIHPTGFLVKKSYWDDIENKKEFFYEDSYGIYPHGYIYSILAPKYRGIWIRYNVFDIVSYRFKSCFYNNESRSYWWEPDALKNELNAWTLFVEQSMKSDLYLMREIIANRYLDMLKRATVGYFNATMDYFLSKHYGYRVRFVEKKELYSINYNFVRDYIRFLRLNCRTIGDALFLKEVIREGYKNRKEIRNIYNNKHKLSLEESLIERNRQNRNNRFIKTWLRLSTSNPGFISEYFKSNDYSRVAIYGCGEIGKCLYNELLANNIQVQYYIDQKADFLIEDVDILTLENELPKVDVIIVTLINSFDEISKKIKSHTSDNVISIEDVIYGSWRN